MLPCNHFFPSIGEPLLSESRSCTDPPEESTVSDRAAAASAPLCGHVLECLSRSAVKGLLSSLPLWLQLVLLDAVIVDTKMVTDERVRLGLLKLWDKVISVSFLRNA